MTPINKVYSLIGSWNEDIWDLANCGIKNVEDCIKYKETSYRYIKFSGIRNEYVKKEIKYYIFNALVNFEGNLLKLRDYRLFFYKWFIKYFQQYDYEFNSLVNIDDNFNEEFIHFLENNNVNTTYRNRIDGYNCSNSIARFPRRIREFFIDIYNKVKGKDSDVLYLGDFNLSAHRVNLSCNKKTIKFYDIRNEYNKDIFKDYIKHLIFNTQISLNFICTKHSHIRMFLKFIGTKKLVDIDRNDIDKYKEHLLHKEIDGKTYNIYLLSLLGLFEFGVKNKLWEKSHIYTEFDLVDSNLKIKGNIVDDYIINQILKKSHKMPLQYLCMFLLLYCCGMRISEVCILKIDSIKKDDKGYYIVFYQQKMKKEVSNPLSKELYLMLEDHREYILQEYGKKQEYLFPREGGYPMLTNTYRTEMNILMRELDIRTINGEKYRFRPHEYRHTFATNLIEKDVPFSVVQKLLHHNSPEMSLVYTQLNYSRKEKKYLEFIDIVGKKSGKLFHDKEENERLYEIEWLKKNLKAQALPNGFCSLPTSLGQCPYANVCLTCNYFKTTKGHLSILKKQLNRTEILIDLFKNNNEVKLVHENLKVKTSLEKIIKSIEEGE